MTAIDDAWNALRQEARSEPGWHVRRVHASSSCEILAGIRQPGSVPGLLLEVSTDDIPARLSLPKSKGFVVDSLLLEGSSGRVRFALVLADRAYEVVFSVLCDDTARAASTAPRPRAAVRAWVDRLHVWQEFMARHGVQGLSETTVIGLFGELLVLRDIIAPAAGIAAAIQSWSGPLGEPNDFAFSGVFLEVKATTRQVPELIEISDADQLDDTRGTILLAHVRLRPSSGGETLPQLVSSLRAVLAREEASQLKHFEQLLMLAGYIDPHANLYDRSYILQAVNLYRVAGAFPRLRRSDIPDGVRAVSYAIDTSACSNYSMDMQDLKFFIRAGENG